MAAVRCVERVVPPLLESSSAARAVRSAYCKQQQPWKLEIRAFISTSQLLSVFGGLPTGFNKELRLESLERRECGERCSAQGNVAHITSITRCKPLPSAPASAARRGGDLLGTSGASSPWLLTECEMHVKGERGERREGRREESHLFCSTLPRPACGAGSPSWTRGYKAVWAVLGLCHQLPASEEQRGRRGTVKAASTVLEGPAAVVSAGR